MERPYRASAVAPMGLSPPVATEFVRYLIEAEDTPLTDVTLIGTREPAVRASILLASEAIKSRYRQLEIHEVWLESDDIASRGALEEYALTVAKILAEQRVKHRANQVHVCISGGRKEAGAILYFLSQLAAVSSVIHVIMKDVKLYNIELEKIKDKLLGILDAPNKAEYYNRYKENFDKIMYPPLSAYEAIKIPLLPYPSAIALSIKKILLKREASMKDVEAPRELLNSMILTGLIHISGSKIYATDEGFLLGKILSKMV
ncbi:MAG: CRISPR-associated ring nuclease [Thermoproteota archaeon]